MNKIGIFGDSFAEPVGVLPDDLQVHLQVVTQKKTISWINEIGASSHATGGTDIQYSLGEFEKYHSKYDQVICVLTDPHRLTLFDNDNNMVRYVGPGTSSLELAEVADGNNQFELRDIWNGLKLAEPSIFINTSYRNRSYKHFTLCIDRMKQLRPDVKLIPAFNPEWQGDRVLLGKQINEYTSLYHIMMLEEKIMNWNGGRGPTDNRIAHLTEDSHIVLTRLIKEWLTNDKMLLDIDIKEFENIKPDLKIYDTGLWTHLMKAISDRHNSETHGLDYVR
mgnify:CR=1 FL=1